MSTAQAIKSHTVSGPKTTVYEDGTSQVSHLAIEEQPQLVKWSEGTLTIEQPTWQQAIGSQSSEFSCFIAEQLVLLSSNSNTVSQKELSFMSDGVIGIGPKDHVEAMLATQMMAIHSATVTFARRLKSAQTSEQFQTYAGTLNKLARTFAAQAEALKRYRTGGKQHISVKHVHVHEGGQAIVGNVTKGAGGV